MLCKEQNYGRRCDCDSGRDIPETQSYGFRITCQGYCGMDFVSDILVVSGRLSIMSAIYQSYRSFIGRFWTPHYIPVFRILVGPKTFNYRLVRRNVLADIWFHDAMFPCLLFPADKEKVENKRSKRYHVWKKIVEIEVFYHASCCISFPVHLSDQNASMFFLTVLRSSKPI